MRKLHRTCAMVVALFVLVYVANHLALAVAAVFAHLGCALARRAGPAPRMRALAALLPLTAGVVSSGLVLAALMGKLYPYEVPQAYKNTYPAQAAAAHP